MKPKHSLRSLLIASSALLAAHSAHAATYVWDNSNVTGTPTSPLDWFSPGPNSLGLWTGVVVPVSGNTNTIQFFQDNTTQLLNTANPSLQTVNLNNSGNAFELGTLTLSGRGSATTNANLTMTLSGDALNFSAATGTINLDALNATRTITYNVNHNIELGTASSAGALTLSGNGNSTFNIGGIISELQAGGGSLIKSGTSTVSLTGANTYSGTTTLNSGTLNLSGSAGSISDSTGIILNGGGITLTNTDSTEGAVNRVSDTADITSNGGTFTYNNTSGNDLVYAETIGEVDLAAGQTNFVLTNNMAGTGNTQTLTLTDLTRSGTTSTVTFSGNALNATSNIINNLGYGGSATPAGQIIGPWATTGTSAAVQNKWATYDSSGNIVADSIADTAFASWTNSTTNAWSYNTGSSDVINTTYQAVAVRYYGAASTLTLGTGNLETYGLIFTGGNTKTVASTGGVLTTPTGGGNLFLMAGNVGTSSISAPISDNDGAVTVVVGNSAGRILTLSSTTSTYTGGTVINSGILSVTANSNLGAATGGITLHGGELRVTSANLATARDFTVGTAGGSLRVARNNNITTTGNLIGSGTLNLIDNGGGGTLSTYNFNSSANTFTGGIVINNSILGLNSLADSANSIVFNAVTTSNGTLNFGAGAIAPLVLNNRPIEINGAGSSNSTATIQNNNTAYAITIGGDVLATGAGAKTLALGAVASPATNIFSGDISDGTGGGTVAVTKTGAGTWVLSGTNTYTGKTFNNSANGTLIFQDVENSLSPGSALTTAINSNQNQVTRLLSDTSGTITLGNTVRTDGGGSSGTGTMTLFVGNNNVVNGGSSSGTTTGSEIVLGTLDLRSSAEGGLVDGRMASRIAITGANDYKLEIGDVIMQARGTSSSTGAYFNPTTAPLIITGTVKQNNGRTATDNAGLQTLTLDGTATANEIKGAVKNATDFDDSSNANALATSITKSSLSTWTLSGANSYTGGTTITTGKLVFSGANSLPTTGTIAVGANGRLSIADGVARNQTVSALTLTSGAGLAFDWTGDGTGDQLTSTADITPTSGSNFGIELNRSGTPAGNVALLTGGAGSTLNDSNFYLANATNYTATLSKTATTVSVGSYAAETSLTTMYWMGNRLAAGAVAGVDNAWALSDGTVSNWSSANGTYAATSLTPGSTANVIFSNTLTGRAQQSTVLGSDVTVNSLVIADATAVTIAGANGAALSLMSGLSTAGLVDGTPGSAITVTSTANATSTINSRVNLGSNQTWNVASGKTLVVGGEVAGNFSLTKADAGTVILNGVNTYSGDTTISAGTLRIGNNTAGTLGGGNYAGNIVNNGLLQIWSTANQTLSGVISGSGNLQKAYGGSLTLAGNNTYTGQTLLQPQTTTGFTVFVSSFNSVVGGTASSSLGAPTTVLNGTIELGGGTQAGVNLTYTGSGETTDRVINFAMNGNGATKTLDASGSGLLKFTSTFTKSGSNTNDVTLQGAGNGEIVGGLDFVFRNFTKTGTGTWTLGANLGHTGTTTISGGTMELNSGATIGGGTYSNTIAFSNSSTLRYNSTANQTLGGVISGAGSLVKDNTGTLILTNADTYTGATTVNAGTLLINGSTSVSSAVAVNGGTLGGTGTIGGAVSVAAGATLSPGASIESLATGALTMASNSTFFYEVTDNSPTGADLLGVNGALSLTGVNLSFDLATAAALSGGGWIDGNKLTLISYIDAGPGITSGFTGYADDTSYIFGTNSWLFDYNDTTAGGNYGTDAVAAGQNRFVTMTVTVIPEPSTALLGALGALLLLRRRR